MLQGGGCLSTSFSTVLARCFPDAPAAARRALVVTDPFLSTSPLMGTLRSALQAARVEHYVWSDTQEDPTYVRSLCLSLNFWCSFPLSLLLSLPPSCCPTRGDQGNAHRDTVVLAGLQVLHQRGPFDGFFVRVFFFSLVRHKSNPLRASPLRQPSSPLEEGALSTPQKVGMLPSAPCFHAPFFFEFRVSHVHLFPRAQPSTCWRPRLPACPSETSRSPRQWSTLTCPW